MLIGIGFILLFISIMLLREQLKMLSEEMNCFTLKINYIQDYIDELKRKDKEE